MLSTTVMYFANFRLQELTTNVPYSRFLGCLEGTLNGPVFSTSALTQTACKMYAHVLREPDMPNADKYPDCAQGGQRTLLLLRTNSLRCHRETNAVVATDSRSNQH